MTVTSVFIRLSLIKTTKIKLSTYCYIVRDYWAGHSTCTCIYSNFVSNLYSSIVENDVPLSDTHKTILFKEHA